MSAFKAVEDLFSVIGALGVLIWRDSRGRLGGDEVCDMSAGWLMTTSILESVSRVKTNSRGYLWCRWCITDFRPS